MDIIILNTADTPIYEQIKEQIKAAIVSGSLQEGQQLPSIRVLAKNLQISVITTTRAYNDLEQGGFLASVPGKGFFVGKCNSQLMREHALCEIEEHLSAAIEISRRMGVPKEEFQSIYNLLLEDEL